MKNDVSFGKNILIEIASISIMRMLAMVLINIASYLIPLVFIYFITELLYKESSNPIDWEIYVILLTIVLSSFILNLVSLNLELKLSKVWCDKFKSLLISNNFNSTDGEVVKISTISFNVILDNFPKALSYYVMPIIVVIISVGMYFILGNLAFYATLLILLFLPLSIYLAKKSDVNYDRILTMSKERVLDFKHWSAYAPYRLQLEKLGLCDDIGIDETQAKIKLENRYRSLDTGLRGVDGYIIGFGRLMPIILLSLLGFSASMLDDRDTTIFLWLCIPILQLVLSLPSTYTAKKMVDRSLSDLNSLTDSHIDSDDINTKDYMSWPVWSGNIRSVTPFISDIDQEIVKSMLSEFRLIPELGDNLEQVLEYFVSVDGSNLSAGQLVRLKIIRGFVFSYNERKPFYLINNLDNVDKDVCLSITNFVNDYNSNLTVSVLEDKDEIYRQEVLY